MTSSGRASQSSFSTMHRPCSACMCRLNRLKTPLQRRCSGEEGPSPQMMTSLAGQALLRSIMERPSAIPAQRYVQVLLRTHVQPEAAIVQRRCGGEGGAGLR